MSRSETVSQRLEDSVLAGSKNVVVKNIAFGVNLYQNAMSIEDCEAHINLLNSELSSGKDDLYWGSDNLIIDANTKEMKRNAVDFVMDETILGKNGEKNKKLYNLNSALLKSIKLCIDDYCLSWGIVVDYYEPLIVIKYNYPDTYFKLHIDHGPHKSRTVSAVMYLNDDYEGGELWLPRLDNLTIKPKTGDIVVFPSTYMYIHESKQILSGTKYSVAAMTDYSNRGQNGQPIYN
jgi:hypothetical protein